MRHKDANLQLTKKCGAGFHKAAQYQPDVTVSHIWVCVFLTWPCREVGIRGMNRRYGSGYGSGV